MDLISDSDKSILRSGFFGVGIEDVNLPEAGHGATVTYGISLRRLAFAVVRCAIHFVSRLSPEAVTGVPEISRARLVGDIAQHLTELAIFDFPEGLSAELKVVALLIDRPASVSVNENPIVHAGDEILQGHVFAGGFERYVRHA